jgi:hypothetical protein
VDGKARIEAPKDYVNRQLLKEGMFTLPWVAACPGVCLVGLLCGLVQQRNGHGEGHEMPKEYANRPLLYHRAHDVRHIARSCYVTKQCRSSCQA